MKIFLISPVRGFEEGDQEFQRIKSYVENLRKEGHTVHWPKYDTDQNDDIGTRICRDNGRAIIESDEIHIWWTGKSQGSIFDFGMAFMAQLLLDKKIRLANPSDIMPKPSKDFNNVLLDLHGIDLRPYLSAVKKSESQKS